MTDPDALAFSDNSMSVREFLSGLALVGLTVGYCDNGESPQAIAGKAVAIADALIERLNQPATTAEIDRDADGRERG